MNRIYTTIVLSCLSLCVMAQQQDQTKKDFCKSYTSISAGYSGLKMYSDNDLTQPDADLFASGGAISFSLGSNKMMPRLSNPSSMYAEIGAELSYNTGSNLTDPDTKHEVRTRLDIMSVSAPISIGFRTSTSKANDNDCFVIFAGISPKLNLSAKMKTEAMGEKDAGIIISGGHKVGTFKESYTIIHTYDLFSDEDMGENHTAERFQFGLHAGLGFEFGNVSLQYKFTADISPFLSYVYKNTLIRTKTNSHVISISYIFRK